MLSAAARELLESDAVATVVTLNADGAPHLTVAWVGLEGDEIVFGTLNFPAMPNPPSGFVTRVTVRRVAGIGPWRDT